MSDDRPKQVFFSARELFSTPGYVAYSEPDKVTYKGPVNREMVHVGFWRAYAALRNSGSSLRLAAKFERFIGAGRLTAAASVVAV